LPTSANVDFLDNSGHRFFAVALNTYSGKDAEGTVFEKFPIVCAVPDSDRFQKFPLLHSSASLFLTYSAGDILGFYQIQGRGPYDSHAWVVVRASSSDQRIGT
jgi:hypothetical protein